MPRMMPERLSRRLADAINPPRRRHERGLRLRWGIIDNVRSDNTLDVRFGGSSTITTFCPALKTGAVGVGVGDRVVALTDGVDLVILSTVNS